MNERAYIHTRYGKRASYDSGKNSSNNRVIHKESKNKSRSRKEDKFELSLKTDLRKQIPSKKNKNISINHTSRLHTHRINIPNSNYTHGQNVLYMLKQSQNLSELREQVEQLRMENQILREELNLSKTNEKQMQNRMMKMEEDRGSERKQYYQIMNEQQQKIEKYGLKIKQLYEELIQEKKKKIIEEETQDMIVNLNKNKKVRQIISPTLSSITNLNYFYKFQQQGQKQFYTTQNHNIVSNYQTEDWKGEHSYPSSSVSHQGLEEV